MFIIIRKVIEQMHTFEVNLNRIKTQLGLLQGADEFMSLFLISVWELVVI